LGGDFNGFIEPEAVEKVEEMVRLCGRKEIVHWREREREDRGTGEVDSRDYVNRRRVVTGERRVCPPFHPSVRKMSGLPADEVVQDGQGTLETQQLQQLGQGHEVVVGAVEGPRKGEYEGC